MSSNERRHRRSDHPAQAVHFYLRSLAERDAYRSVALADSCGHRIASAGDERETKAIASAAPLAFSNPDLFPADLRGDDDVRVWSVVLGESAYYLATVGGGADRPYALDDTLDRLLSVEPLAAASA